ncbi:MAG TPA: FecR family protein [Kofleriaceae bacterium]|nr:FecR family protein [Kofleriaceae bacterium]
MKLVGRVPVEPLDDERLTNIERRIVAGAADAAASARPVRAPRWNLAMAFAVVVVCVAGAGVLGWTLRGGRAPAVAEREPIAVRTDDQRSTLDIGDATIQSARATAFTVTRPDGGVLVAMARGKVELQVGKRGERPPLVVRAGDTDVVVIGTHFTVDYDDHTGKVRVDVTEGVVKVVRHQKETRVSAGQSWQTDDGVTTLAANEPRRHDVADPTHKPDKPLEIDMGTAPDVLHDRVAQVPDVRTPAQGSGSAAPNKPDRPRNEGSAHSLDSPKDPYVDLKTDIRAQPVAPPMNLGIKDPAQAITEYLRLANITRGDDASTALYSVAVIQHQKLGKSRDALATLDQYIRRFKGGKEYVSALWLRVRILCLDKIDSTCRQAAYTYVHEAGDSPTARVAERITMSQ